MGSELDIPQFPPAMFALSFVAIMTLVRWAYVRRLLGNTEPTVVAERIRDTNRREGYVFGALLGLLLVIVPAQLLWAGPLIFVIRAVLWHPVRRRLLGESWSAAAYTWFFAKLTIGLAGFWLLLLATPALTSSLPGRDGWLLASAIGTLLLLWNRRYAHVLRWLLRTRSMTNRQLVVRFADMVARSGLPPVTLEEFDVNGGVFANAVALPTARGAHVVVSNTLIHVLDTEEAAAVCAHELAHVEQYTPRRLRRLQYSILALIATGVAIGPLASAVSPGAAWWASAAWAVGLIYLIVSVLKARRRDEAAADVRAIELCGDPEALCRALTKLHDASKTPHRWSAEVEKQSTHPSLARRLEAIRAAVELPRGVTRPSVY